MADELTSLANSFQQTQKQRKKARAKLKSSSDEISSLNVLFSQESQKAQQNIAKARQSQLGAIDEIVEHDSGFWGYVQQTDGLLGAIGKAKRNTLQGTFKKAEIEEKLGTAKLAATEDSYKRAKEQIGQEAALEEKLLQFDEDGLVRQEKFIELGIDLERLGIAKQEAFRKQEIQQLEDASAAELTSWLQDPNKAPKGFRNKPGLVSMALNDKVSTDLSVRMQQTQLQNAAKSSALGGMQLDQLEQVMNNQAPLPQGLEAGDIEQEFRRRSNSEIDLQSAQLALQSGQIDLAQQLKDRVLMQQSSQDELRQALSEAEANEGFLNVGGMDFTSEELRVALQNKTLADRERENKLTEDMITQSGLDAMQGAANLQGLNLQSIYAPGTEPNPDQPYAALPAPAQAEIAKLESEIAAARAIGNIPAAAERTAQLNTLIEGAKEKTIEAAPKIAKDGYREFVEKGRIDNPGAAAGVLFSAATNPKALVYDETLGPIWETFTAELNTLRDEANLDFGIGEGGELTIPTGKKSEAGVLIEQAIQNSRAREMFSVAGRQTLLLQTIEQLVEAEAGATADVWKEIYNPTTGQFNDFVYESKETETGTTEAFSLAKLSELLAMKSVAMQNDGTLPNSVSLGNILYEHTMGNLLSSRSWFGRDINASALGQALFGNRPETALVEPLGVLRANQPIAMQKAQEVKNTAIAQQRVEALEDETLIIPPSVGNANDVLTQMAPPVAKTERQGMMEKFLGFAR